MSDIIKNFNNFENFNDTKLGLEKLTSLKNDDLIFYIDIYRKSHYMDDNRNEILEKIDMLKKDIKNIKQVLCMINEIQDRKKYDTEHSTEHSKEQI